MQDNEPPNTELKHLYDLGTIVEVYVEIQQPNDTKAEVSLSGTCRLIVVGHLRDRGKTPLYVLSDLPVKYPVDDLAMSTNSMVYKYIATVVESGYGEESLNPTGDHVELDNTVADWLMAESRHQDAT